MSVNTLYQKLREQFVALTVEIEDRENVCRMLERKVESERGKLSRIDEDINEKYAGKVESEKISFQAEYDKRTEILQQLQLQKKQLLLECKDMVDRIRDTEKAVAVRVRDIYKDADQQIETERKLFRSGHEERLAKYLASKAFELKETTERTLQPEFSRLQQLHEQELLDLEVQHKSKERALREEIQQKLLTSVEEERLLLREKSRTFAKEQLERTTKEIEDMERDHRRKMIALQEDLERDFSKQQRILMNRVEKDRHEHESELSVVQEEGRKRLEELRLQHEEAMVKQKKDYDRRVQEMSGGIPQSPQRVAKRSAISPRRGKKSYLELDTDEEEKWGSNSLEDEEEEPVSRADAPSPLRLSKLQIGEPAKADAAVKEEIDLPSASNEEYSDLLKERDKRIQSFIQQTQAETVRLERQKKAKHAEEMSQIQMSSQREEEDLRRQQRVLSDTVADLVVRKQQLEADVLEATNAGGVRKAELEEARKEIRIYEEGLTANRLRAEDNREDCRRIRSELTRLANRQKESQNERIEALKSKLAATVEEMKQELKLLDNSQEDKLKEMDKSVKFQLAEKEAQLDELRDAIETEKVRIAKFEALMKKYTSKPETTGRANSRRK